MNKIYNFEIHVTVANDSDISLFQKACEKMDVRGLVLELVLANSSDKVKDLMTSSGLYGEYEHALEHMNAVSKSLSDYGLKVIREKIETMPGFILSNEFKKDYYLETHYDIFVNNKEKDKTQSSSLKHSDVKDLLSKYKNIFISKNTGKEYIDIVTYRNPDLTYEDYMSVIHELKADIKKKFTLIKMQTELSIYDTNKDHDKFWTNESEIIELQTIEV